MISKFAGVGYFDYLEQRVLDDRVRKPGGNIGYFRSFFLGLLYLGIHENSTAGA